MDEVKRIENALQYSLQKEKSKALLGAVLIVENINGSKVFKFEKLENVLCFDKKVKQILQDYENQIVKLNERIALMEEQNQKLEKALIDLSNYIDNQRFL